MGVFNAAYQWRTIILMVPQVLGMVMLPVFPEIHGRLDRGEFQRTVASNLRSTWSVALPAAALVTALAHPSAALFGRQFAGAAQIIGIMAACCPLFAVNYVIGSELPAAGRLWTGLVFNTAWAAALVTATLVFVPSLGATGLALACVCFYARHTAWQLLYLERTLARGLIRRLGDLVAATIVGLPAAVIGLHPPGLGSFPHRPRRHGAGVAPAADAIAQMAKAPRGVTS